MQPFPDHLLDPVASSEFEPERAIVTRETIELAYLAAIQHLPPRQRAILILRDALDWSANDTADLLETTVTSVNSALRRARAALRDRLPARAGQEHQSSTPSSDESALLARYMAAHDRRDELVLAALLREDARLVMPPFRGWYDGRATIVRMAALGFDPDFGHLRGVATAANRQPAAAWYLRRADDAEHQPIAIDVLRIEADQIAEITTFPSPELFAHFGLPRTLPP